jgi:hypothetical protein
MTTLEEIVQTVKNKLLQADPVVERRYVIDLILTWNHNDNYSANDIYYSLIKDSGISDFIKNFDRRVTDIYSRVNSYSWGN